MSEPPLAGITVVALEQAVAAPFATRQLADLGARVIKIERPDGGDFARGYDATVLGQSSYFVWLNRGKESVALDLKDPADREVLTALLDEADVFVQNLAPGAADRLGLSPELLRLGNPRLIVCSLSGYGEDGPYRSKKAYDLLVQCEAGVLSVTGTPEEPAKVGLSIADIAAGMYCYTGILTALYERERTGVGTVLNVAMLEAIGEWMSQPFYYSVYGDRPPIRAGARHASIAPYGPYAVGGGDTVFIGVQNDREWASLCNEVLRRPDLVHDERFAHNIDRVAHDAALTPLIESALADVSAEQAQRWLDECSIANARLRTPAEYGEHPQLAARDRWRTVATPAGEIRASLPPVTVLGREAVMAPVPRLGEHTESARRAAKRGTRPGAPEGGESFTEVLTPGPAHALAGLLGVDSPAADGLLPMLWHWVYLLDRPPTESLGPDGHRLSGGFPAPPGPGRRRMFAGGRLDTWGTLRLGEEATRDSEIVGSVDKHGRSGLLTFVTVRHRISQRGHVVVQDEQDIVYRQAVDGPLTASASPVSQVADTPVADNQRAGEVTRRVLDVDPVLLFRFSALTYNGHRIHYDRDYAREKEGYPGLVVHGPLQAIVMAGVATDLFSRSVAGTRLEYRFQSPLFDGQGLIGEATEHDGGVRTSVCDAGGRLTATGQLRLLS